MRKFILISILILLAVAYFTRPDDKACIIGGVRAVWGDITPVPTDKPEMFEAFMNLNSVNVIVKDRLFFKQVKYKITNGEQTVAFGAFKKVFAVVAPVKLSPPFIPKMK